MHPKKRRTRRLVPKKAPRQARARTTYASILDATARILVKRGYAELTTNHVAQASGVAIGSVYEYFPDKETMVAELTRRTLQEISVELAAGLASTRAAARVEGLDLVLKRWVALLFRVVEARGSLLARLQEVPFYHEIDEVRVMPAAMIALASEGRDLVTSRLYRQSPQAWTFIVTTMVMNAVVESVVRPPAHVARADVEDTLYKMLLALTTDVS
jgi:AcrR family transcriptional regulator